jgi:hypothetical protein
MPTGRANASGNTTQPIAAFERQKQHKDSEDVDEFNGKLIE